MLINPFKLTVEQLSNYLILKSSRLRKLMEKKLELEIELAILQKKDDLKLQKQIPEQTKDKKPKKEEF